MPQLFTFHFTLSCGHHVLSISIDMHCSQLFPIHHHWSHSVTHIHQTPFTIPPLHSLVTILHHHISRNHPSLVMFIDHIHSLMFSSRLPLSSTVTILSDSPPLPSPQSPCITTAHIPLLIFTSRSSCHYPFRLLPLSPFPTIYPPLSPFRLLLCHIHRSRPRMTRIGGRASAKFCIAGQSQIGLLPGRRKERKWGEVYKSFLPSYLPSFLFPCVLSSYLLLLPAFPLLFVSFHFFPELITILVFLLFAFFLVSFLFSLAISFLYFSSLSFSFLESLFLSAFYLICFFSYLLPLPLLPSSASLSLLPPFSYFFSFLRGREERGRRTKRGRWWLGCKAKKEKEMEREGKKRGKKNSDETKRGRLINKQKI